MMIPLLQPGDTVGIVAPSSPVSRDALGPAKSWLESFGYNVRFGASVGASDRFLAGPDAMRAGSVVDMFTDNAVRAVFVARGGYGSSRILELIDWAAVAEHPKWFVGFSDTTALQIAMLKHSGLVSLTGLALASDVKAGGPNAGLEKDLIQALTAGRFDPVEGLNHRVPCEGRLVGGCLSLITHLLGTPHLPDLSGCLLLVEDLGESPYKVDRLLTQLILSGVLAKAAGVVFGVFHDCECDTEDGTIDQVLADFSERCPCPVILGMPYGHGPERRVLPIGGYAKIVDGVMTIEEIV